MLESNSKVLMSCNLNFVLRVTSSISLKRNNWICKEVKIFKNKLDIKAKTNLECHHARRIFSLDLLVNTHLWREERTRDWNIIGNEEERLKREIALLKE